MAVSRYRQVFGRWGEDLAEKYLIGRGYKIIGRNIRTAYGELDLVCQQGLTWVFVEVKTRKDRALGLPETSITSKKQRHLLNSAQVYLQNKIEASEDWRIDVIAIIGSPSQGEPEIEYFENAVVSTT